MTDQIGGGTQRHGDGAGADRHMGRGDTDDIHQQRHGDDRATATHQAQDEADQGTRKSGKEISHA